MSATGRNEKVDQAICNRKLARRNRTVCPVCQVPILRNQDCGAYIIGGKAARLTEDSVVPVHRKDCLRAAIRRYGGKPIPVRTDPLVQSKPDPAMRIPLVSAPKKEVGDAPVHSLYSQLNRTYGWDAQQRLAIRQPRIRG